MLLNSSLTGNAFNGLSQVNKESSCFLGIVTEYFKIKLDLVVRRLIMRPLPGRVILKSLVNQVLIGVPQILRNQQQGGREVLLDKLLGLCRIPVPLPKRLALRQVERFDRTIEQNA
jgi:hypothetical protein